MFDQNKYIQEYIKEKYTRISLNIPKKEAEEFKTKLKKKNLTTSGFLKDKINKFMEED